MINVLVVDALARASGERYSTFDVVGSGPRIIAGIVEQQGHNVLLKTYEETVSSPGLIRWSDILMISIMSSDIGALERIIRRSMSEGYRGKIIIGGPGSFDYQKILRVIPRIDMVVVGEAERQVETIFADHSDPEEIFQHEYLESIPSVAYIFGGEIKYNGPHIHTSSQEMSRLKPWVRIEESYPHHSVPRYYVEVVRGCSNYHRPLINGLPGLNCIRCMLCYHKDLEKRVNCPVGIPPGCGFCSVPYMFGPPRSRSVESIVREVEGLIEHGARRIVLSAPGFLDYGRESLVYPKPLTDPCDPPPNTEAIEALLSSIHDLPAVGRGRVKIMVENVKACLVTPEVAEILGKYLRGTTIHVGLETGDPEYNRLIGKPITPQHVYRAVKLLRDAGLRPYVYLMYGLPLMRTHTYGKTIEAVRRLRRLGVEKITLYKFTPLPYTAFSKLRPEVTGHEKMINILKRIVRKHNLYAKRRLIGQKIKALLLVENKRYYAYPFTHGPVVFVEKTRDLDSYDGCLVEVEVRSVHPRHVSGRFIRVIDC